MLLATMLSFTRWVKGGKKTHDFSEAIVSVICDNVDLVDEVRPAWHKERAKRLIQLLLWRGGVLVSVHDKLAGQGQEDEVA